MTDAEALAQAIEIMSRARKHQEAFYGRGRWLTRWEHQQEAMKAEKEMDKFLQRFKDGQRQLFDG